MQGTRRYVIVSRALGSSRRSSRCSWKTLGTRMSQKCSIWWVCSGNLSKFINPVLIYLTFTGQNVIWVQKVYTGQGLRKYLSYVYCVLLYSVYVEPYGSNLSKTFVVFLPVHRTKSRDSIGSFKGHSFTINGSSVQVKASPSLLQMFEF